MADRVSSDHPSVTAVEGTLVRQGRTDRPKVELPADAALQTGEVVRIVLDGSTRRARFDSPVAGDGFELRGVYDTPRLARNPGEGPNRLAEWVDDRGLDFDRTVHLDVVETGFIYGLRAPGEQTVYEATERPADSLADIAERLDGTD